MNKQHLYTSLFLALSSAYLSGCTSQTSINRAQLDEAQQQQLSAERAGHLRQTHVRFNALDKDEDGYISRAEFSRRRPVAGSGQIAGHTRRSSKDSVKVLLGCRGMRGMTG